jgi:hypothetical protein
MNPPPDPFEFLKNLWGPMGLPMAGLGAPKTAMSEVDRRIAELKSVENWLNMNLNVLRMAIQGLEMQKAGLAAMQNAPGAEPTAGAASAAVSTGAPAQSSGGEASPKK